MIDNNAAPNSNFNRSDQPESTALTTKQAELGQALLAEAENQFNQERQKFVLREVQRLLSALDDYKAKLVTWQKAIDFYTRKIEAIKAGEFECNLHGMAYDHVGTPITQGALTFKDPELNRPNF